MSFQDFNSFINSNELLDIGFEGFSWTWCNNWNSKGEVKERIDRILGNESWIRKFEKAKCTYVEAEVSDHCILVLDTKPVERKRRKRFMFDRRWLQQRDIGRVIENEWEE